MKKRLVIALGGNALGKSSDEQLRLVKTTASTIVDLVEEGCLLPFAEATANRDKILIYERQN